VVVLYVAIFLLAIPGNLVVGLVIGSSRHALSPSDLYLLHLAVADILLALTLPFWATSVSIGWLFGDAVCKVVSILQELSFYSSILFLACISVDRYLVIVRAMEARAASRRQLSWAVCAVVWFAGGLLSLPSLYNSAFVAPGTNQTVCAELFDLNSAHEWKLATRGLRHILGFGLPLGIMIVCYGVTIERLFRTRGGFQRQRAMRVIIAVVVAFLLCWMPYHLAVIADTLFRTKVVVYGCQARDTVSKAVFFTQSLGLLHSCVNPVLYAFVGEKFRQKLIQILRRNGIMERVPVSRVSKSSISSEITSTLM
ncbi:C-X-C chemokine receptor type 1-like, partial [Aplochiton taeniatus]